MLTLATAELFIGIISLCIAYIPMVSIAGFIRAWIARLCGDDTPERMGFLTLNPLAHIDIVGVILLFVASVGWGRYILIDPSNIEGPWEKLKIIVAYLSDALVHILMALVVLVGLVALFGVETFYYSYVFVLEYGGQSFSKFAQFYPSVSPAIIACVLVGYAFIYLNILSASLRLIIDGFNVFACFAWGKESVHWRYRDANTFIVMLLISMILMFLVLRPLQIFIMQGLLRTGSALVTSLGIV